MNNSFWVIGQDGQAYGPADVQTLTQWAREGRLTPHSTLQDATTNHRLVAAQVPALSPIFTPAPQAYPQQGYPQQGYPQAGYPQPGYQQPIASQQQQTAIPAGYDLSFQQPAYQQPIAHQPSGYAQPTAYQQPGYQALAYGTGYGQAVPGTHQLTTFSTPLLILLHFVTFGIYTIYVHFNLMHGKMAQRRPDDPSVGKAIGFMFIPIFSLYWVFFTYLRLCDRINDERRAAGLPANAPRGYFLACMICCIIPFVNYISILIMFPIWVGMMQSNVNELVRATRGPTA